MSRVIGICGHIGAGKTTLANQILIHDINCFRIPFAEPLKNKFAKIASELLGHEVHREDIERDKNSLHRPGLQWLGEFMRQKFGQDYWIDIWKRHTEALLRQGYRVVVDDLRYPNEVDMIRSMGGTIVKVVKYFPDGSEHRPLVTHSSEAYVESILAHVMYINREQTTFTTANMLAWVETTLYPFLDVKKKPTEQAQQIVGTH